MATPKQYSANMLRPNQTICVIGTLGYNNVTRPYAGDELTKRNNDATTRGRMPYPANAHEVVDVNIHDPKVMFRDPSAPTLEELYVQERFFMSAKNGLTCNSRRINSGVPTMGIMLDNCHAEEILPPSGYITGNPQVMLVLRTFKGKNSQNAGLTLDAIIFREQPTFSAGGRDLKHDLETHGIIWKEAPKDNVATTGEDIDLPFAAAPAPVMPQQPVVAPASQMIQPIVPQMPVAVPAAQPVQPAYVPPATIPPAVMEAASQAASLYEAPVQPQTQPGIRYDVD